MLNGHSLGTNLQSAGSADHVMTTHVLKAVLLAQEETLFCVALLPPSTDLAAYIFLQMSPLLIGVSSETLAPSQEPSLWPENVTICGTWDCQSTPQVLDAQHMYTCAYAPSSAYQRLECACTSTLVMDY